MRRLTLALAAAMLLGGCGATPPPQPPEEVTLDNGLTVMLRPMQDTEKVALVVLYAVGGLHDPKGQSGLAHLIEHCYVTAAAGSTPQRDMQGFMARYPDGWNAQTGDDYTVIGAVFGREALDRELQDAAARMRHLRVLESDLAREKPRIFAELRNMYASLPHLALVLAGAFDAAAARAAIGKYFGDIPPGDAVPKPAARPKAKLPATETIRVRPIQPQAGPVVGLAYAAPKIDSDLHAPFLVLVGRLWNRAQTLGAAPGRMPIHFAALDDPAAVSLCAPMTDGEEPDQAVARLEAFVAEAAKAELATSDRMVTLQVFNFAFGLLCVPDQMLAQNLYGVAFGMGRRAQMGVDSAALKQAIETVTTDDLRRAAETVFSEKVRAAVVVIPQ